jgi:predicted ATPase/DNA-binding SARP family transcriptional activator
MGPALDVFTLGGLRICLEHERLDHLRSRAAEGLFVYLVCQGRPLSRERLAEFFWPERSQESSLANLRVALHRLRKPLAPHLVVTRRSLSLRDDALPYLDRADFERLLGEGKLREALGLYHGDFLDGFFLPGSVPFESWVESERRRLHELAVAAYGELALRRTSMGDAEEAIRLARGLLKLEPLHEPTQRLLLRLLAQSGRRQAGIEGFERYRRQLHDELGLEPDGEAVALLERVRDGLEDEVPMRGGDAIVVPPRDAKLDLPPVGTPLVGRQADLDGLVARLADGDCRLVTIVAPGGMGKTRLAIEAARRMDGALPDGACFVPLAGVLSPEAIVPAVLQGLALTPSPAGDAKAALLAYLRSKRMLLVLDNFDELLDGAPLLLEIVRTAPGVTLLVTSRERVALTEEWLVPLAGLDADEAAIELFVQRAERSAPDLDAVAEHDAIRDLCRLVEGMPLAIELAASWAGIMRCREIADAVRASLDVLRTNVRDLPERHRSIRSLFDTSWNLLTPEARSTFMRLSVFRGGFAAAEARAVAGATLQDLRALVEKSLLRADGRGRFIMHELVRQYAGERLAAAGALRATAGAHFDAYLTLAEEAEPQLFGSEQPAWLLRLELEWDNFRAALVWGSGGGVATEGFVRLVLALSWFWRRGAIIEARRWLDVALEREAVTVPHRAALLSHAGHVAWIQGRWDVAEAELTESLVLWDAVGLGWGHGAGRTRCSLAMTYWLLRRPDEARPLLEEALVIFRRDRNAWWVAFALGHMAKVDISYGEHDRAKEHISAALAIYRRLGNRWGLGLFLGAAAKLELAAGRLQEARALAEEACELLSEIGLKYPLADIQRMLGQISAADRRPADAKHHYLASIAAHREAGQDRFADDVAAEVAKAELGA